MYTPSFISRVIHYFYHMTFYAKCIMMLIKQGMHLVQNLTMEETYIWSSLHIFIYMYLYKCCIATGGHL